MSTTQTAKRPRAAPRTPKAPADAWALTSSVALYRRGAPSLPGASSTRRGDRTSHGAAHGPGHSGPRRYAHRVMRGPAGFALLLAILLASTSIHAAKRPRGVGVRLDYERGAGARQCPNEKMLRGAVAAEFGSDRFTEAGPWRLRAAVTRGKNGAFVATAELFDGDGATVESMGEMGSPDCRQLVLKGLALWASVKLTDPPLPPPSPPTALPSAAPTLPLLPAASPPPLPTASPPPLRLRLGAATGIEFGVGPTPTPLFSLNVALQSRTVPIVSLAFEVRTDLPLPATVESGVRVHAHTLTGSLLTCFHAFDQGLFFFCPMFTVGLFSSGERFSTADARGIYSAGGGRLGAAIPFGSRRFAFTFAGDVLGTLRPVQLWLEERPVWHTGSVTGAVQAGFTAFL